MAKTFDPNRVLPGTIELVRDANGNYTTKVVGLETINSLSLPEISDTAAVTKTDTDTKTATEITGDTVQKQTQMAFKTGADNQPDTTGDMLQEAKKTSGMLSDTFANTRGLMTSDDAYRGVDNRFDADTFDDEVGSRIEIKDPTSTVFGRPKERTIDQAAIDRQTQKNLGLDQPELKGSAAVQRGEAEPPGFDFSFLGGDRFKQGTASTNPVGGVDQMAADAIDRQEMISGATADDATANTLGITADPTQSATRAAKEADFASGILGNRTVADSDIEADAGTKARADIKPKESALKTVSTSLKSAFKNIKTPMMMVLETIGTPRNETEAAVNFNKRYFTDRGDGRIGGNPATDLFAGMNRVSAFGNLNQAGAKRISRRENTIEKKGYGPGDKFYDDTQKMKEQLNDYREGKAKDRDKRMGNTKTQVTGFGKTGLGRDTSQGGGDTGQDSGGKSIVCTAMYQTTGLQDWAKAMKIWYIYQKKYLTIQHQEGYHKLFKPFVKAMHKSNTIKAIGAHFAKHRTQHLKYVMFNSKPSLLGKIYNKILEPLCYWAGKK